MKNDATATALKKHAGIKARAMFKENPAFLKLKMKGSCPDCKGKNCKCKESNLPKGNKRSAYMTEMQDMGKE